MIIKSGPAELVRVLGGGTGAGNVGIGTATPGAMLEVNGNIKASGLQNVATSTDPGCTVAGDIGRQWIDNTSSTTTHFKVCAEVASSPTWISVF